MSRVRDVAAAVVAALAVSLPACTTTPTPDALRPRSPEGVVVTVDLPSNPPLSLTRKGPTRWHLTEDWPDYLPKRTANHPGYWKWWMFRVDHAAGLTLDFEIQNPINGHKWSTLCPVYMNGGDPNDPASFEAIPVTPGPRWTADNGASLPDTTGQLWHDIPDAHVEGDTLHLRHTFTGDRVWIAMRYPFTQRLQDRLVRQLGQRAEQGAAPDLKIHQAGTSAGNFARHVITIGETDRAKPTVLMYGREHAQDQDASWVIFGAIEFLLSDRAPAPALREQMTWVFIPTMDRYGATQGMHNSIRSTFRERDSDEALAYSAFFDRWKQDGQRVDLVFNFHNNESNENPHFFVPWFESYGRPASADLAVYNRVRARLERQGLVVAEPPNRWEVTLSRLAGHVAHQFKAAAFLAMVNSRAEEGHLTLEQLKAMGEAFVLGCADHLAPRSD